MTSAVEAPDLSGLIELSRNPRLDLKPVLLRVQTDLFLSAPIRDRDILEAFASLVGGLIPTVDRDTALLVAGKLAPCSDTPEQVLLSLVQRGPAIAEAVLTLVQNPSSRLIEAVRLAGIDADAILAARAPVVAFHEPVDEAPAPTLAERIVSALRNAVEAQALLSDPELMPADLAPLWLHASPERRAEIREAVEATAALRSCPPAPRGIGETLTAASKRKDVSGFVAALADALALPRDFLESAPDAVARYDLLTLALRAVDLTEAEAFYVFLSLNDAVARSVPRVFELVQMYRTTNRATARELLSAVLNVQLADRAGTGEHRAYLAPDAREPRRGAAIERVLPRAIEVKRTQRRS